MVVPITVRVTGRLPNVCTSNVFPMKMYITGLRSKIWIVGLMEMFATGLLMKGVLRRS